MAKEPLKLMPLKDLDKVVGAIATLAVEGVMPKTTQKAKKH
jgi:hypothetical protein